MPMRATKTTTTTKPQRRRKAMYYTFKDNRSTEFSVYMPTETEAEIFAKRNYLTIVDKRITETF